MDAVKENRIAEKRVSAGISRYRLAKDAGIKWETLRDIETGRRRPQAATLRKIEQALAACQEVM